MVEEWLDKRALELLKTPVSVDDDVSEIPNQDNYKNTSNYERKNYNPAKLDVFLPNSTDMEQIEYFPPDLSKEQSKCAQSTNVKFIEPTPRFDIFEHLSFKVIPLTGKK